MGIFERIANSFGYMPTARTLAAEVAASPWSDNSHLVDVTLDDLFGTNRHTNVNRSAAMKIATVAKARNTICPTIGRLPLYTEKNKKRTEYQMSLLAQPERSVPLSTTLTWTVDALMFYPRTWWVVRERDALGWPIWVEWIDQARATLDVNGKLAAVDNVTVNSNDVIRFDAPTGTGILDIAQNTLRRAVTINNAAALAEDNPVPTIELHNDGDSLTKEEIEDLLDKWSANRRRRGVAYTSKGLKAIPHGQQVEQLLIDGRKQIQLELARHLNVPAWVVDVTLEGSSLNYTNRQSRNGELIDLALAPYMSAIVDRLSMPDITPRGWRVKFDTDDLTKPDQKTRFETYKLGVDAKVPFITQEQINEWEGWPAPTGQENAQ